MNTLDQVLPAWGMPTINFEYYPHKQLVEKLTYFWHTNLYLHGVITHHLSTIDCLRAENERLQSELATVKGEQQENPRQCVVCGVLISEEFRGRKKRYCSNACKQKAKRKRQ
jgi:hypothetical protein